MRWIGVGLMLLGMVWSQEALAQDRPACFPQRQRVNVQANMADITVSTTAVQVFAPNVARCQILLKNNGSNPMRCAPVDQGKPTSSLGLLMNAGDQLIMTTAGREAWACIRSSSSDTTATTIEELP